MADQTGPVAQSLRRVQLLPVQMGLVLLSNVVLLFIPLPGGVALIALAYGAMFAIEWRLGVVNPFGRVMLGTSAAVWVAHSLEWASFDLPSVLLLFYVVLAITSIGLLVSDPAAGFGQEGGRGSPVLQRRTVVLWMVIHLLGTSCILALISIPQDWARMLIYLLPLLPLCGVGLTLWMHFGPGRRELQRRCFSAGDYAFEKLQSGAADLLPFYRQFIREALPAIREGIVSGPETLDDWVNLKMALDKASWPHTHFFVALDGEEVIGTISCTLKSAGHSLGFESGHSRPLSVQALCRYGRVLEVGRLSVADAYRYRRDVLQGLFRCVIEQAFRTDVAFLVTQSYLSARPVYQKIGFFVVDERVAYQTGLGAAIIPMAFNLAARVVNGSSGSDVADTMSAGLAPYCAERYFKRQALRALFSDACAWKLTPAAIVALLKPATSAPDCRQEASAYAD